MKTANTDLKGFGVKSLFTDDDDDDDDDDGGGSDGVWWKQNDWFTSKFFINFEFVFMINCIFLIFFAIMFLKDIKLNLFF